MPAISVLLPVRDAGAWLGPALASLWRQRFRDFEVVAVDDGSRDGSGEALERAARGEPWLRVIHTPARGLPQALNRALEAARAPAVARHDADDLSHRDRLALQHAHLERNPADAVVGCRLRLFPAAQVTGGMRRWALWHNALLTHEEMAREALIDSPLAHGTALMRRAWIERIGGWHDRAWAEDVDLWLRLIAAGGRLAKCPRVLYGWRQHPGSATRRDPRYGRERFFALRRDALERGLLAGAPAVDVVGVGRSLQAWRQALARPGRTVRAFEARTVQSLPRAGALMVLVFGAARAREARRRALRARGLCEGRDFVFVA